MYLCWFDIFHAKLVPFCNSIQADKKLTCQHNLQKKPISFFMHINHSVSVSNRCTVLDIIFGRVSP